MCGNIVQGTKSSENLGAARLYIKKGGYDFNVDVYINGIKKETLTPKAVAGSTYFDTDHYFYECQNEPNSSTSIYYIGKDNEKVNIRYLGTYKWEYAIGNLHDDNIDKEFSFFIRGEHCMWEGLN